MALILAILLLAILFGAAGFAVHLLWIAAGVHSRALACRIRRPWRRKSLVSLAGLGVQFALDSPVLRHRSKAAGGAARHIGSPAS